MPDNEFSLLVARCPKCGRASTEGMVGRKCRMTQPVGPPCDGILHDVRMDSETMDRFFNPAEDDDTGPIDDLDIARQCLRTDVASVDEGVSDSLRAIAHVLLWQAEQHREFQRQVAEAARKVEEWRAAQPPPPPPPLPYPAFPPPYPGF